MSHARISDILALSAKGFKVRADAIKGSRGKAKVCAARLAVYYIARLNKHTCTQIGRMLGNRDHSTVSDGVASCQRRMDRDEKFRALVNKIAGQAAALPPFVMERREKVYAGRIVPHQFEPALIFDPDKFFKPKPAPAQSDDDLDDIELLSRAVAAHYAGASA